ncbi:MAG: PQQ-like beta-propeller repeat protein [Bifidobacteriaceae bacterium]|jgi:hypothetical protein|nr:PQQ-like beta-propeller repeat protein [Bifidobacteriaceae bacterium]
MSSSSSSDDPAEPGAQGRPASCDEPAAPAVPTTPATPTTPTEPAGPAGQDSAGRGGPAEHPVEDDGPTPSELDKLGDGTTVRSVLDHAAQYAVDHDLLGVFDDDEEVIGGGTGVQATAYGTLTSVPPGPQVSEMTPDEADGPWDKLRMGWSHSVVGVLAAVMVAVVSLGVFLYRESRTDPDWTHGSKPTATPVSTATVAPTPKASASPGAPSVGRVVTAYDTFGGGWVDYEVGPSPAAGRVVVYATPAPGSDYSDLANGKTKTAVLAEVSLADAAVRWRLKAASLCAAGTDAVINAMDADGAGDTVVQLGCTGPDMSGMAEDTVTIGPNGTLVSRLVKGSDAQYLGTVSGVTAVRDADVVTAYRATALKTVVWFAPAKGAVASREVVAGVNGAVYVWAEGGYRELVTGQPAGFGAYLGWDDPDAGFRVVDGQVFGTRPDPLGHGADVTPWTVGVDAAVWEKPVTTSGGILAAAGGTVITVTRGSEVTAWKAGTDETAWTYRPADAAAGIKAVLGDAASGPAARFVVIETDGVVWLDAATGQVVARVTVSGLGRVPSAALTPDGVVVVTAKGLVGVGPDGGGEVAWTVPLAGALRGATIAERGGAFYLDATTTPGQVQAVAQVTF